jgi:hypothetical protein
MTERRYNEAEVAAIFELATRAQHAEPHTEQRQLATPGAGMTMAQLEEIGREVGISPAEIHSAAKALTHTGQPAPARRFLGITLGVGRTIELNRRLTDAEWERLVVDLRETFEARGRVWTEGSLKQWTNGNLQALLEPTETGHRVRLRTFKGRSFNLMLGGVAILALGAFTLAWGAMRGLGGGDAVAMAMVFGAAGAGMIGFGAMLLPSWARLRKKQMEDVAGRLAARIE